MAQKRVHILTAVNAAQVSKEGGKYTVKAVSAAVDGIVMNGMLYPGDQLKAGAASMEGKPAPAGHPKNSGGQYISALNGEALLSAYIGSVCTNARHEGGRTLTDIVINEAQARAHPDGLKLVERLDAAINGTNSEPIHVSTGLVCDVVNASGESLGKRYERIATNIRYDHLAILLNERGAGTPEEGVGMWLNSAGQAEEVETAALVVNAADTDKAVKQLSDAIALHQDHMDGKEPTTGPEGDKSQMKMMRMMKAALAALTGKSGDKGKGMAMNVATVPADLRHDGFGGWLRKLLGNASELSFDQIHSLLRSVLPDGAWPVEVYARHLVWVDQGNKLWRQDYAISSDGVSVSLQGEPVEVVRRVDYQPVTTNAQEKDEVKDKIVAALNAAGIPIEGKDDSALLVAYNALVGNAAAKPHMDALTAANSELKTFKDAAQAAKDAERDTLAAKLATNAANGLTVDDFKGMPLETLKKLDAAGKGAAPVIVGNAGQQQQASEFAGYSLNAHTEVK